MNKTIASISAAIVASGTSLSAFVPAVADFGVTSDITFASEYVFRGIERADQSFQPSVEANVGDFYVGVWANLPIQNRELLEDRGLTELNYYGGFAVDIPGVDFLTLDLGAKAYHFPRTGTNRNHEVFAGTKFQDLLVTGLGASVYYFYDIDLRSHVVEGSLGYSFDLNPVNVPASIDAAVLYGNQSGRRIREGAVRPGENYHYYGASLEMPFRLNEFSKVTAGVHYQTAERVNLAEIPGRGQNLFWTISYAAGF